MSVLYDKIKQARECYYEAESDRNTAFEWLGDCATELKLGNVENAGNDMVVGLDYLERTIDDLLTTYGYHKYYLFNVLLWINSHWPEDGEPYVLTWKAICEAWAKNDFEGKEWTIACIDHMRKLMWDKPFRIVWASKPKSEAE